ncbi:hypothetical protein BpHYR1_022253 [Brachionus plicatilis]|uniref:Uncharacterized protein n=1 Tax=Brachionus plicatilis TaxID=10195 RepID=A0A3M7RTI7_BRAPC|nr:hypothetical protein BpHYR1_022253 [Brachionus plicatilis]
MEYSSLTFSTSQQVKKENNIWIIKNIISLLNSSVNELEHANFIVTNNRNFGKKLNIVPSIEYLGFVINSTLINLQLTNLNRFRNLSFLRRFC